MARSRSKHNRMKSRRRQKWKARTKKLKKARKATAVKGPQKKAK